MKKRIRGLKRAVMQLDFDLYRVKAPMPDQPGSHLSVINLHPQGVESETDGQRVKAFVAPRPDASLSKNELLELCKRRLVEHAVPWEIEFRQALPRSFIGKVLRRVLHEEERNRPKDKRPSLP